MKVKTRELIGHALDWAVASLECDSGWLARHLHLLPTMPFSTDWSQGGPIIERENLSVSYWGKTSKFGQHAKPEQWWEARHPSHRTHSRRTSGFGPTPLVATMRCYVASKLGDEVDVPEELL